MTWHWPFGSRYRRQLDLVLAVARDLENASLAEILGRSATRIRDYYGARYACMHPTQDQHLISDSDMATAFQWCPAHGTDEQAYEHMELESHFYHNACRQHAPIRLTEYLRTEDQGLGSLASARGIREAHAIPLAYQGEDFAAVMVWFDRTRHLESLDADFLTALGNLVGAAMQREWRRLAQTEYDDVISALGQVVEARDGYSGQHIARVMDLSVRLAHAVGLSSTAVRQLRRAAALHDIGKVNVPDSVLNKPGPLSDSEWQSMKKHAITGGEIVRRLGSPDAEQVASVVRHHHERLDGQGYPDGLSGEAIPLAARIVSICDSFDAMISDRPYRQGMPVAKAVSILRSGAGTQWDARLVEAFVTKVVPQVYPAESGHSR